MATLTLEAEPRSTVGRGLKVLRDQGYVPAVLYGHGLEARPIQVEEQSLDHVLASGGTHGLISLSVAGADEEYTVLAREVQRYPTRPQVLHVDFYRVLMTEKMQASVPLVVVGKSPAVVEGLAALVQSLDSLAVECLPGDLPDAFEVDISVLERTDQNIVVADIPVPAGVDVLEDPDLVLFSLAAARPEEEEEEEEELFEFLEPEEVEVVVKGKAAREMEEEGEADAE